MTRFNDGSSTTSRPLDRAIRQQNPIFRIMRMRPSMNVMEQVKCTYIVLVLAMYHMQCMLMRKQGGTGQYNKTNIVHRICSAQPARHTFEL